LLKTTFCILLFFLFLSIDTGTTKITTQILECSLCDKNFYLYHSNLEHYLIPVTKAEQQQPIAISNDNEYDKNVEHLEPNDLDADLLLPQSQCTEPELLTTSFTFEETKPNALQQVQSDTTFNAQSHSKNYQCLDCDKSFVRLKSYNAHILKHYPENNTNVVQSPTPVAHEDSIKVENVSEIIPLVVQPKVTAELEAGGRDKLPCTLCGLSFSNIGQLKRHSKMHRGKKRKKLVCGICGRELTDKSSMEQHMAIHLDLKNFKCNYCGKMFRQRNNLIRHNRIHTGVGFFYQLQIKSFES
jgi:uncharacterized Zn-finger protein